MPAPSSSTPLSTYPSAQPHLSSAYDNAFSSPPNQPRPDLPADSSVSLNSSSAVSSSASSSAASHASTSLARSAGKRLILPALDWVERMDWIERLGGRFELVEERVLGGYAMYAVGDWLVDRSRIIPTAFDYTGHDTDQIAVLILRPSSDLSPEEASLEVESAISFLSQDGSRPKEVSLGIIMVLPSAAFPVNHSPMRVPLGDFRLARDELVAVVDLVRLGCSGRAHMELGLLNSEAPRLKFHQLFHISTSLFQPQSPPNSPTTRQSRQSFSSPSSSPKIQQQHYQQQIFPRTPTLPILTLVRLIQASLQIYNLLPSSFIPDGLLCDSTLDALRTWSEVFRGVRIGSSSTDDISAGGAAAGAGGVGGAASGSGGSGVVDPGLVALLISSVWGVRWKLGELGWNWIPKDPFINVNEFLRTLVSYQKHARFPLPHSTHLDLHLIEHIHHTHHASDSSSGPSHLLPTAAAKIRKSFSSLVVASAGLSSQLHITSNSSSSPGWLVGRAQAALASSGGGEGGEDDGDGAGAEGVLETDRVELLERRVRLFGRRDGVETLRWLWMGEGDGPEKWVWGDKRRAELRGKETVTASQKAGGLKKIGTLVGKVKGGFKQIPKRRQSNVNLDATSESDAHVDASSRLGAGAAVPGILVSAEEGSDDDGPDTGRFHPHTRGHSPLSGVSSNQQPLFSSANSTLSPLRGYSPSLVDEFGHSIGIGTDNGLVGSSWATDNWEDEKERERHREVERARMRRCHSFSHVAEYMDLTLESPDNLKIDRHLLVLFDGFLARERDMRLMVERYQALLDTQNAAISSLVQSLKDRRAQLAELTSRLSSFPTREPQATLLSMQPPAPTASRRLSVPPLPPSRLNSSSGDQILDEDGRLQQNGNSASSSPPLVLTPLPPPLPMPEPERVLTLSEMERKRKDLEFLQYDLRESVRALAEEEWRWKRLVKELGVVVVDDLDESEDEDDSGSDASPGEHEEGSDEGGVEREERERMMEKVDWKLKEANSQIRKQVRESRMGNKMSEEGWLDWIAGPIRWWAGSEGRKASERSR